MGSGWPKVLGMGRPRNFDFDTALGAALDTFWAKGFEGTSISDLEEATGLQRGSLYQAFGDKKALFMAALDGYLLRGLEDTARRLGAPAEPLEALEKWFEAAMSFCPARLGCLAVNATTELAPHDPDVARRITSHWKAVEEVLEDVLGRGQSAGEVRTDLSSAQLAQLLLNALAGAQVMGKQRSRRTGAALAFGATLRTLVSA